ncbi:MAG TPA: hypothetical protein VN892_05560 [Solirubrobacteraceae bacterium]|nr:hypothetical protein [Solirubrobacteraceae bacterium]
MREALREAEAERGLWMQDTDASPERRRQMILRAEAAVEAARAEMYELPDLNVGEDVLWLDGRPIAGERWDELSQEQKRAHLRRYVGKVTVTKSTRGRWQAISERIEVRWIDGSEPVLADDLVPAA